MMNENLTYMLQRVTAVSTQSFKLNPQNSTTAQANSIIRVSQGSLNCTNLQANTNVMLYLEHTCVLQIGPSKQFSIVN